MTSTCPGITEAQIRQTNGCGSSAWYAFIFRIPRWFSHDFWCACNQHDLMYQNTQLRNLVFKLRADDALVTAMYGSAFRDPVWIRAIAKRILARLTMWALETKISEWCWYDAKKGGY